MTELVRRNRTVVSSALLIAGCLCLGSALDTPTTRISFVRAGTEWTTSGPRLWEFAFQHRAVLPLFLVLLAAPALWIWAAWFRSAWARWGGALLCAVPAVVVSALLHMRGAGVLSSESRIAFVGSSATTEAPGSGWIAWSTAAALFAASFLVLPPPERPAPGEADDPEVIRRARLRSALVAAAAGTALLVVLATSLPPVYMQPGPDHPARTALGAMNDDPPMDVAAWVLCLLPLVVAAACVVRRARWAGVAAAAAVVLAMAIHEPDGYWMSTWAVPVSIEEVTWYATPSLFLVAFLLLPPRRANPA